MDVLGHMNAAFAERFEQKPLPKTVAEVPVCGCREAVEPTCKRRLCVCCCGLACDEQHDQRDDV